MKVELAIKFGSNEIIVFRKGRGIVARESSYVATYKSNGKICAYGDKAKSLCSLKGSQYVLHQPIQGINIINVKLASCLLNKIINDVVLETGVISALVAVPCALTEKKLLELKSLLQGLGIYNVTFVQNSVCVRSNLTKVPEDAKIMIVDIGKFITDVSILTKYDFINGRNYLVGGGEMDFALATYIEDNYNVTITEDCAETVKNEIASMFDNDMYTMTFEGINAQDQYQEVTMRASEARVAIIGVYDKIFDLIEEVLDELPSNILAEVKKHGIMFTGGVSSIDGLVEYASKRLNMPIYVIDNPKDAVILGAGKLLSLNKGDFPYIKL